MREYALLETFPALARTATGNGTGIDLRDYIEDTQELAAFVSAGAVSGTTPTLDLKIQESDDNVTFTDITGATFTQITATGTQTIYFRTIKRYVRAVATIGGTTPSFTFAVEILALKHFA